MAAGYLRRAVSNEILSVYRRHQRFRVLAPLLQEYRAQSDPAEEVAAQFTLWGAFDVLSARQRVAVVLRYYHGFSDEEIAAELECPPATVRTLLSRALKRLRTRWEGAWDA
jgi:RNA polymerase sigma factor (sigma-70 family)